MKIFLLILGFVCAFFVISYLVMLIITRKPFKFLFINALCGAWLFAVIELTQHYTSLHIPLNYPSAITTGVLGMPGVALLLILRYIIFI